MNSIKIDLENRIKKKIDELEFKIINLDNNITILTNKKLLESDSKKQNELSIEIEKLNNQKSDLSQSLKTYKRKYINRKF